MRIKVMRFAAILFGAAAIVTALIFMLKAVDVRGERTEDVEHLSVELQHERDVQQLLRQASYSQGNELAEVFDEWTLVDAEVDSLIAELGTSKDDLSYLGSVLSTKDNKLEALKSDLTDKIVQLEDLEDERDKLALDIAAQRAANKAAEEAATSRPCGSWDSSESLIRCLADYYGVNPDLAVRVAFCESSLNPNARNPRGTSSGLFQQMPAYWAERLARFDYPTRISIFDPWYNAAVSVQLVRDEGWYKHWKWSYACWGS